MDSVKTEKEKEEASRKGGGKTQRNLKQLSTKLLGAHYWASLLGRGECDWPSIKTDFYFSTPHQLQPDAYYPVTELFEGWMNDGGSF